MKKDNKLKVTYRVNAQIRVPQVRIVGDGIESQVVSTSRALQMADDMGVDLVEISPNAEPPVCRLIEFSKFIYQQKKHAKGSIKEVRAWVDKKSYIPRRLRIKVAFIWTTVKISDFHSGGINDDIFIFPRENFKDWKFSDKRKN